MKKQKDDMKYWKGGSIILDMIKKNVPKSEQNEEFIIWRPKKLETLTINNKIK